MKTLLVLEDENTKAVSYREFGDALGTRYGFHFVIASTPSQALRAIADDPTRLDRLAGVIADFEVGGSVLRSDRTYARGSAIGPRGDYPVTTGLGVLDWFHVQRPDLPLWAMTSIAAGHAPLYMSAASLWLDAKPLHVDRIFPTVLGQAFDESLAAELTSPAEYLTLNPQWKLVDDSRAALESLFNAPLQSIESFDWIHALVGLSPGRRKYDGAVQENLRAITGTNARAYSHTLAPAMARWQLLLEDVYRDYPVEREADLWPAIDEADLPTNLSFWDYNPFVDFLRDNRECREFFESADVRTALARFRERGDRP